MKGHVTVVLPTGYGKSLIYEILPFLAKKQRNLELPASVIVVLPLNAIISEKMEKYGKQAIHINSDIIPKMSHLETAKELDRLR